MKLVNVITATSLLLVGGCLDDDDDDVQQPPTPPPTFSASQTFEVTLSGKQQVPNNGSAQTAMATVEVDETLRQIRASVDLSGIDNITGVHIHDGDLGRNGDVAFQLTAGSNGTYTLGETDVSATLIDDLKDGDWYLNVHTDAYPDGEIRGQIVDDGTVIVTFPLSGSQEVPAVDTDAMGYAYASVDTSDYSVDMVVYTEGVDDATAAHIHTGRLGNNGDVLAALEADSEAGVWVAPEGLAIDEATFNVLASGGHYVNVHTPANESGELRGQILTDNFALVTFGLNGEQEVPAVTTMAMGDGYAFTNFIVVSVVYVHNG